MTWVEGPSAEKLPPSGRAISCSLIDTGGDQLTVSRTTPRQAGLSCIRKVDEQAVKTKPVSTVPPWPLLEFRY